MKRFFLLSTLMGVIFSANTLAVTIDEAYAAIPHKRPFFDAQASRLPSDQSRALVGLFELVEQALVLKVDGLQAMQANNSSKLQKVLDRYEVVVLDLKSYPTPTSLESTRDAIAQAIQLHQNYFKTKLNTHFASQKYDFSFTDEIYESSNYLRQAYQYLMENKAEIQHNKAAFYDYLCSLDFI